MDIYSEMHAVVVEIVQSGSAAFIYFYWEALFNSPISAEDTPAEFLESKTASRNNLYFPTKSSNWYQLSSTMAGASDKARFYMEQTVPQLQEFEQKKIFTKVSTSLSSQQRKKC